MDLNILREYLVWVSLTPTQQKQTKKQKQSEQNSWSWTFLCMDNQLLNEMVQWLDFDNADVDFGNADVDFQIFDPPKQKL